MEDGAAVTVPYDLEGFAEEIQRYGFWKRDIKDSPAVRDPGDCSALGAFQSWRGTVDQWPEFEESAHQSAPTQRKIGNM
jgi:hypothetical protein